MSERVYYRSKITGDLGWLVERDGQEWIQLDRGGFERLVEKTNAWEPEEHRAPLNKRQVGKLTYEFDQLLCRALGRGQEAKRDWIALQNEEQMAWLSSGPKGDIRAQLWEAVNEVLEEYADE